jgi:hypothetical protein
METNPESRKEGRRGAKGRLWEYDLLYVETFPLKDANRALHSQLNKAIAERGILVIEE